MGALLFRAVWLAIPAVLLVAVSECSVADLTAGPPPGSGMDAASAPESGRDDASGASTEAQGDDGGTAEADAAAVSDVVWDASSWDAPTGAVFLQNALNLLYLDVAGASLADSAQVVTSSLSSRSDQYWSFKAMGDTSYEIVNSGSSKCLDDQRGSVGAGTSMIQFTCNGNSNQRWYLVNNQGNLSIQGQLSGRCLASQSLSNPDVVIINDCSTTTLGQQWFVPH